MTVCDPQLSCDIGHKVLLTSYLFSFFSCLVNIYTYFTNIAASSTVTDDVTDLVTRRIFNTNLKCCCDSFTLCSF